MKRTIITMDEYGRVAVPSDTAKVWTSELELVSLLSEPCTKAKCCSLTMLKSG